MARNSATTTTTPPVSAIQAPDNPLQLRDYPWVCSLTRMSQQAIRRLVRDGQFPRPINIGRSVRFVQGEVEEHLKRQVGK
jgi:predicted DNA-binding transcriptional regulator AlpA